MLTQQDYILNTEEEYKQIESVKEWIQNIHESGTFFNLSLKTLELIRRFNNLHIQVFEENNTTPSNLNQLVITSKGLETQLIREN
ncbi:hypothetical protein [Christiangramia forsetii]|uniref:Uncharacterized protein n=2 Tax=Christiangramia forsetii TaxID=411153 RepID=A0M221_CHRFK|nr:hypothetical protein [Christiangramia forsetii]GGG44741.1 hypothetical protein GCM10011532_30930 [Christiangramia forsetii]CAL66666.1 hypothetical protein GFO_1695 [Christiangramia forsetii KT0803]